MFEQPFSKKTLRQFRKIKTFRTVEMVTKKVFLLRYEKVNFREINSLFKTSEFYPKILFFLRFKVSKIV